MTERFKLPLMVSHEEALVRCAYCPKLSRAACPVSNIEGNETVTPWGKMSLVYFAARGDVPIDEVHAESAWACSGCYACRERCEHGNEVASVLLDARADLFAAGAAPAAARAVAGDFAAHAAANRAGVDELDPEALRSARIALLIGCSYVRHSPEDAHAIWEVTKRFADSEVRALRTCCGLPLLQAGDRAGALRNAQALREELTGADVLLVADPGCARALQTEPLASAVGFAAVQPLIDLVHANLDRVPAAALAGRKLRYHDPCQLGRGLGRYEEPRAILARLTGRPPGELPRARELAECSGGGGMLPASRPDTSASMADERIAEHRAAGGGTLVTACGSGLRRFRSRGADVVDLMSLVAEACCSDGAR